MLYFWGRDYYTISDLVRKTMNFLKYNTLIFKEKRAILLDKMIVMER